MYNLGITTNLGTTTNSSKGYFSLTLEAYGYSTAGGLDSADVAFGFEDSLRRQIRQGITEERINSIEVDVTDCDGSDHSIHAYVQFTQGVSNKEAQQIADSIGCSLYHPEEDYFVDVRGFDFQY